MIKQVTDMAEDNHVIAAEVVSFLEVLQDGRKAHYCVMECFPSLQKEDGLFYYFNRADPRTITIMDTSMLRCAISLVEIPQAQNSACGAEGQFVGLSGFQGKNAAALV